MQIATLDNMLSPAHRLRPAAPADSRFEAVLGGQLREAAEDKGSDGQAREAAQKLVASAFVLPLLSEMRESPLDAKLFHGGFAEDAFRQRLDTIFADNIVKSARFPLVDRIQADVMRRTNTRTESFGRISLHG